MYRPEPDNSLNPAFNPSSGILQERNTHCPPSPSRSWLDHITESCRRRHKVFLLKQRKEKLRRERVVRRRKYQRLRNMVPSIAKKPAVSKVAGEEKCREFSIVMNRHTPEEMLAKGLDIKTYCQLKEEELNRLVPSYRFTIKVASKVDQSKKDFEVGELVWAKMKGYMPWPGKIMVPPAAAKRKKNHHYVFFFGSEDHAWIPDQNIQLHSESLVEKYGNKKPGPYRKALDAIIEHNKKAKSNVNNFHSSCSTSNNFKIMPMKKTFSAKKPSLVKKSARKLTLSCDKSDPDDSPSKKLNEHHMESCSPKVLDGSSAQLISNICPTDGNCSSLTQVTGIPQSEHSSHLTDSGVLKEKTLSAQIASNISQSGNCSSLTLTPLMETLQSERCSRPSTPNISPQVTDMPQSKSFSNLTDSGVYNLTSQSEDLSKKKIGFLGLGTISQGILKNLKQTGHFIIIYKYPSNESDCGQFAEELNIRIANTPEDVICEADITFSCVSDADIAKSHAYGPKNLPEESARNGKKKGYVEMSCMDPKSNIAIGHDITKRWGRYLEAPLSGSTTDANDRTLLSVAAGDRSLYEECKSVFDAIAKNHFFVSSEVGTASKLCIVHNMFLGTVFATVKEALTLVERMKLKEELLEDILKYGALNSQNISEKGIVTIKNEYDSNASLKKIQQELILGRQLGERLVQSTPIFAAAREVYKRYV